MPLDYTGVGAARFDEQATLAFKRPWVVEDETSLRVRIRAALVGGAEGRLIAGFVCFTEAGVRIGTAFHIDETLTPSSSFIEIVADNDTWPAGTAEVYQVMQLVTEGAIYEIDEFSVTDVTGITQAQNIRTLLSVDYYTREDTNSAIAEATTLLQSQVDDNLATVIENYYTKSDTDSAISSAVTSLESRIGDEISATLSTNYLTATEVDAAIAAVQTTLSGQLGAVSAEVDDILNLDVDGSSALGTFKNSVEVNLDDLSASVSSQGTAIGEIEGTLNAGLMFKAQAGGQVSLFELLAADGSTVRPTSIARISATDILLNGSVKAQNIDTGSFAAAGLEIFNGRIQSDDYGSNRGFRIMKNGNAVFNNLVTRGWIQEGVVSQQPYWERSSDWYVDDDEGWVTATSFTIEHSGGPILLFAYIHGRPINSPNNDTENVITEIRWDQFGGGSTITSEQVERPVNWDFTINAEARFFRSPGTYTFGLQINCRSADGSGNDADVRIKDGKAYAQSILS